MNSMGYLGMISVPIPRLRTESADADEVSLLSCLSSACCLLCALGCISLDAQLLYHQAKLVDSYRKKTRAKNKFMVFAA